MTIYDKTQDEKIQFPVGIGIIQTEPVRNFYNTSDANATSYDIVVGKTAYSRYGMINGELDLQNEKETSYQEGYEFGYDEGNEAGYVLGKEDGYSEGYSEGNENGYNTGYSTGEQEGYGRGWIEGNNLGYEVGYNTGTENGKTLGREEIISEQSDANITSNDVLEGKIGYGKNNERIVGTNVGGFDFSTIGYTPEENQATNEYYANTLKYSQELYDAYVPTTRPNFSGDKELVYAPLVDTSIATYMAWMFDNCWVLTSVPLFDTSNVETMNAMFSNCWVLTSVPLFDTSNVTMMSNMFNNCYKLTSVPLFDTSNVETMQTMFYNCQSLTSVPLFDTSNVTNMQGMFNNCYALTSVPLFDTSNVTNMQGMFQNCNSLESIPSFNTVKNTNFYGFAAASKLKSIAKLRCDSVTDIRRFSNFATLSELTDLGGFENLGMQPTVSGTNDSYFLYAIPNLTKESLLNVLNGLYDRASVGYSTITLKLNSKHKALLSDDELAIATNKGWIIS